jgi:hypothetical protein
MCMNYGAWRRPGLVMFADLGLYFNNPATPSFQNSIRRSIESTATLDVLFTPTCLSAVRLISSSGRQTDVLYY